MQRITRTTARVRKFFSAFLMVALLLATVPAVGWAAQTDSAPAPVPGNTIRMYGLPNGTTVTYPFSYPRTGSDVAVSFDLVPEAEGMNAWVSFAPIDFKIDGDESRMSALWLHEDGTFYVRSYDAEKAGADDFTGMYATTGASYAAGARYRVTFSFDLAALTYSVLIHDGSENIVDAKDLALSVDPWRTYAYDVIGAKVTNIGQIGVANVNDWEKSVLLTNFTGTVIENTTDSVVPNAETNNPAVGGTGKTYSVGPGRKFRKIQDVLSLLRPGDTVEVAGGTTYPGPVRFGTAGVTLVGIPKDGVKPKIAAATCEDLVRLQGEKTVFDGFAVEGNIVKLFQFYGYVGSDYTSAQLFNTATENEAESGDSTILVGDSGVNYRGVRAQAADITIRNCEVYGHYQGVFSDYASGDGGTLTIEQNEIYHNGTDVYGHNIYIAAKTGTAVVRNNIIRDALADNGLKSRFARNEVYNNFFSNNLRAMELNGTAGVTAREPRRDGDIVGNVFYADRVGATMARVGADGTGVDTHGRFRFVNNTFVDNVDNDDHGVFITAFRALESVEMFNNAFYSLRGTELLVDENAGWLTPERMVAGANNWVSGSIADVPEEWSGTIVGEDPMFAGIAKGSFAPSVNSPLNGAGLDLAETVAAWAYWATPEFAALDTAFPKPRTVFGEAVTPANRRPTAMRSDSAQPTIGAFQGYALTSGYVR